MNIREQVIIFLGQQEAGKQRDLLIVETIMRHACAGLVPSRVLQPAAEPRGVDLAPHSSELRAEVAADKISRRILHRVTGRAERAAVERSCRGGIGWLR